MLKYINPILAAVLILATTSCANFKLHQAAETDNWQSQSPNTNQTITHSMFLVGGATGATAKPTLQLLKKQLSKANENSSILFLGDNISPDGMSPKGKESKRKAAEVQLEAQLDILSNFQGRPIFIPGHQDWQKYGLKGLRRQEKFIETTLNAGIESEEDWTNYFLPDNGCPGPNVVEINDQLVVIIIDSQWWLMDWNTEPKINDGCEVKSREAFALLVADAIKDHKNKNIIIAGHHPLTSYGPYGGRYTVKDHLFPLTTFSENLYIPLPGIGSLFTLIKGSGMTRQDVANTNYKAFRKAILHAIGNQKEVIFVGGHENSLQYIKDKGQHIVVSGAGGKKTATAKGPKALFSYGENGFAKIDFYEDGAAWLSFWSPNGNGTNGKLLFKYQMKKALPKPSIDAIPSNFPEYESKADSSLQFAITTPVKRKTKFQTFMLGEHHQDVYLEKFNFPVLDLATYKGGLKIIKKGGGKQTNSLRLATSDGKEYVMRSLTKDESRSVPYPFNKMALVTTLFHDNYLGSHPFAPLVVSDLADAAKVYHANPNIFYVPKQPTLGYYNENFGGEVYIVEERASKSWTESASFGNAEKFISTYNLAQKMEKNHHHRVDQNWVARSRIFDLMIGDFDRHDDQWRWAVKKIGPDLKEYRPIPRDRDQAFSKYDGFVVSLLSPYNALLRQLADYEKPLEDFKWATYNTRFFDQNFLNELSLEEFKKEAAYIQANMTDEVIEQAFLKLPPRVHELSAPRLTIALKNRRKNLLKIAEGFYYNLAKKVAVHGSDKKEYFEVIRKDDEHTVINMYALKSGKKTERLYHRIIKTSETKEVYLYGLDGNDVFHISGSVNKGVSLHVVGGLGKDEFIDVSKVGGAGKKDHFYDSEKGNKLQLNSEGKDQTSNIAEHNIFDRLGTQYDENVFLPIPVVGFNADDGVLVGFGGIYTTNGFNKTPYAQKHKFSLNYAFATQGLDLTYGGEFIGASKNWDFVVNGELRNNRYSFNFFGNGNDTEQAVGDIDFYRVRQSLAAVDFGWQRRFAFDNGRFSIRPSIMNTKIEETGERFISQDNNGLTGEEFQRKIYGGLLVGLNIVQVDNPVSPRDGFGFNTELGLHTNLNSTKRNFSKFASDFTLYKSFGKRRNFVLASRVGTEMIRGNYDFFFAPTLGQKENIRGMFRNRFRGGTSFFHTSDFRIGLGSSNNAILPFSFGVVGSFDYGRVWESNQASDTWHTSVGGGIWLVPLNLAIVSFTYNKSDVDTRFKIGVGHAF